MNINAHKRTFIFDFDGTMFDTLPSLLEATNETLARYGLPAVACQEVKPALSQGLTQMFASAFAQRGHSLPKTMVDEFCGACMATYLKAPVIEARPYPGLTDALRRLQGSGALLGICTNRDAASTYALLRAFGLVELFGCIVGQGDAALPKPAAAPLRMALDRLGVHTSQAWLVGDSQVDAECARNAEVGFVAHSCGYAAQPDDLFPRVYAFEAYEDFAAWALGSPDQPTEGNPCLISASKA